MALLFNQPLAAQTAEELISSAEAGDAWTQLNLGAAYDNGLLGLSRNPTQAARWYRAAAEQGVGPAQFNLAHLYATGEGVPRDDHQAFIWMEKAALENVPDAARLLGVMYAEGLGVPRDLKHARIWLEHAVEQGDAAAEGYLKKLP